MAGIQVIVRFRRRQYPRHIGKFVYNARVSMGESHWPNPSATPLDDIPAKAATVL